MIRVFWRCATRVLPELAVAMGLLCVLAPAHACVPHIQESAAATTASLRRHTDDFSRCPLDEPTFRRVVSDWLQERPAAAPVLTGISLGRAIDLPWLARYLAEAAVQHPQWDARRGKVRFGEINAFVGSLLSDAVFLGRLGVPFVAAGYQPLRVTVEKVLVGKSGDVFPDMRDRAKRIPFDAQVWLSVRRTQ